MKKLLLSTSLLLGCTFGNAQSVTDTVYIGAGYANQTWYSLPNDEQGHAPNAEWHLAFDVTGFGSTVLINSVAGLNIWTYPSSGISGWSSVDTTGLSSWSMRYNSDTSWSYGALGRYLNSSNPYDVGWGEYNMTTHQIVGDSIYIVKTPAGAFKKFAITSLNSGIYNFKYANLDGSGLMTKTLDKSNFANKNFGYFSFSTDTSFNREPDNTNWDLLFTQYTGFIPQAYTLTGVLTNKGMTVAKCSNIIGKDTFVTWGAGTYMPEINTIGYDWKHFNGTSYTIQDSLVYFVARTNGEIWKMIFTGYTGSTNGGFIFSKEKLYTPTSVANVNELNVGLAVYPNPTVGGRTNLVINALENSNGMNVTITDLKGSVIFSQTMEGTTGLHQIALNTTTWAQGMYVVRVADEKSAKTTMLEVR